MSSSRLRLLDVSPSRLRSLLSADAHPAYRASQILSHVYRRHGDAHGSALGGPATSFSAMSDLPAGLRAYLSAAYSLERGGFTSEAASCDGTLKWLYACAGDGVGVETVFIPDAARRRGTVCISSQAGCTLACAFCRTGTQALQRNLSAGDIVGQVLAAQAAVDARRVAWTAARSGAGGQRGAPQLEGLLPPPVNRVVLMGQGEPLLNYTAVVSALESLTSPCGAGLPAHRLTLSTAGVAPMMVRLAGEAPLGTRLAVSLHAPEDGLRSALMDVNARWGVEEVLRAAAQWLHTSRERWRESDGARGGGGRGGRGPGGSPPPREEEPESDSEEEEEGARAGAGARAGGSSRRGPPARAPDDTRHSSPRRARVSFEYVGLAANTAPAQAEALVRLLRRHHPAAGAHVNIIPFNEWREAAGAGGGGSAAAAAAVAGRATSGCSRGGGGGAGGSTPAAGWAASAPAGAPAPAPPRDKLLPPVPRGLVEPAPLPQLLAFQRVLLAAGIRTTIRAARGSDILGACGQLKSARAGE